ncbi:MAG: transglutaminase-like domain-containing protein [Bacteroidetes bacterium]|nr:transglutaminase-like domain-containing protein [Bacteroidota bacterium]
MKNLRIIPLFIMLLAFLSCQRGEHFLNNKTYREKVEAQFEKQRQLGKNRWEQVFKLADQAMLLKEREALKFILAYSSLNDIADYEGDFFLKNIRSSFAARDAFSWGKTLPDELFRHFVLPIRVNNENLDTSRIVFFGELKDRIKKMSMKDAVIEVNHWCHEKVTYRGTDERTSSPLATVRTAYGRCGEESTFTVAALRSVCIPARQCYTPRWAHSDDNHAWVEVWVDGKWHYIGACEPELVLDAAWFTAPAKRAMLVNTNVFGDYEGPEDILLKDERYTRINILSNYAETKRIYVLVRDSSGKPADSVAVEFQLYNYAEFYPLLRICTDIQGLCSFQTGYGDLIVWASKNGKYTFRKISVKAVDTVALELSLKPGLEYSLQEDLKPPVEQPGAAGVPDSLKEANSKRLDFEDKLRSAYEKTFIDSAKSCRLAATLKLNTDTLWHFLKESRGNFRAVIDFAGSVNRSEKRWLFPLLSVISSKDLRDVTFEVLMDNITNTVCPGSAGKDREIFFKYLLNPRVDNEWLRPCKSYFQKSFDSSFRAKALADPGVVAEWVKTNVLIDSKTNYGRAPLTPIGVYELKVADPHSRDIFFVAVSRSLGIAARLEPGTRLPQYYFNNVWHDVLFDPKKPSSGERVKLTLNSDPRNDRKPEYYIHFTLEKFDDGFFRSLDYETDSRLGSFPCELDLAPGYYLMVTGNRMKDGTVLSNLSFFNLNQGKEVNQQISLRKESAPSILGKLDPKTLVSNLPQAGPFTSGNLVLAWMEPDKEPTKHFIADLKEKRKELEKKNCRIFFLFRNEKDETGFISAVSREMPSGSSCLVPSGELLKLISGTTAQSLGSSLPVVTLINSKGEITYVSQGYRIGIGDDLLKLLR